MHGICEANLSNDVHVLKSDKKYIHMLFDAVCIQYAVTISSELCARSILLV